VLIEPGIAIIVNVFPPRTKATKGTKDFESLPFATVVDLV
jgi:hypothetical protein